jgi:hypothetical protein
MDPNIKLGIYVWYKSLPIIKYLEPLTRHLFITRYADRIFDEDKLPDITGRQCDRTAQNNSVLSPKPVHVAIKQ